MADHFVMRHPRKRLGVIETGVLMRVAFVIAAVLALAGSVPAFAAEAPVRIHAGLLIDGTGASMKDATITVQGDKIASVEQGAKGPWAFNLAKATVLPGLIDTHV